MSLDDDIPTASGGEDLAAAEDAFEEEAHDFQQFAALTGGKRSISAQSLRKGEKDFESHGTRAQQDALERSREVMADVLSYTRVHRPNNWVRGWYFPDVWAGAAADDADMDDTEDGRQTKGKRNDQNPKRPVLTRERVVVVETCRGGQYYSLGRHIPGVKKHQAGFRRLWLLPEEALFLVERGSLDLWWPNKALDEIFPPTAEDDDDDDENDEDGLDKTAQEDALPPIGDDNYEMGLPLSLQGAYALLVGEGSERGKTTLQQYQVFSNLKRFGYHVLRAGDTDTPRSLATTLPPPTSIWLWLMSLVNSGTKEKRPLSGYGPLVQPGLYRSYKSIYEQIHIIPRHQPTPDRAPSRQPEEPFRVHFHVWKSNAPGWHKTGPGPPDFYISVADAQASSVPSLEAITALLESTPWSPPAATGQLHMRLKRGYRRVILAVVDHGIINYLEFSEGAFGEELLWPRFDAVGTPLRGTKKGGKKRRSGPAGAKV